jgi:hypothetical protein
MLCEIGRPFAQTLFTFSLTPIVTGNLLSFAFITRGRGRNEGETT